MDLILALCVGVSLAAACGFRIFVPLLVMSAAAQSGHLTLAPDFAWLATPVATAAFFIAAVLEVLAYYVPFVDHALDTLAAPAAVVAGTVVTAACVSDMSPFLRWSLAVIAGGGTAGVVQGVTSVTRLVSTAGTGGFGNPLVSTVEAGGSTVMAVLAMLLPGLGAALALLLVYWSVKLIVAAFRRRREGRGRIVAVSPAAAHPGGSDYHI